PPFRAGLRARLRGPQTDRVAQPPEVLLGLPNRLLDLLMPLAAPLAFQIERQPVALFFPSLSMLAPFFTQHRGQGRPENLFPLMEGRPFSRIKKAGVKRSLPMSPERMEFDRLATVTIQGGGVYGLSLLGQLQALVKMRMQPVALAGTSAGAIVATLYWAGL